MLREFDRRRRDRHAWRRRTPSDFQGLAARVVVHGARSLSTRAAVASGFEVLPGARASWPRASIDASDATRDLLHGFDFRDANKTILEQPRPLRGKQFHVLASARQEKCTLAQND